NGMQQLELMLGRLQERPSTGRMVVRISSNPKQWEGGPNDVVVRNGDTLLVPKTPNFVLVYGAVYNQTAITYRPGRNERWYLAQAGGPNQLADRPAIFVIRAENPLGTALRPGDMVVVPEKALGQNQKWKTIMQAATTLSSIGTSAAIAARF
ncbi:MAG: sugar transporter, partial [Acidobacteria bacterium]